MESAGEMEFRNCFDLQPFVKIANESADKRTTLVQLAQSGVVKQLRAREKARRDVAVPLVVTAEWLKEHWKDDGVRVVDTTWGLCHPKSRNTGLDKYDAAHIPSAPHYPIDELAEDLGSPYPHMLPPTAAFEQWMSKQRIRPSDHVIVYDSSGFGMAASRVWMNMRAMGHVRVSVLDGGLASWTALKLPTASKKEEKNNSSNTSSGNGSGSYDGQARPEVEKWFVNKDWVLSFVHAKETTSDSPAVLLDARTVGRCTGVDDEPWRPICFPDVRRGRVPYSACLPFHEFLDKETRCFMPIPALRKALEDCGVPTNGKKVDLVATCGSGVTASVLALYAAVCGVHCRVYDGSWCEWGNSYALPLATGEQTPGGR